MKAWHCLIILVMLGLALIMLMMIGDQLDGIEEILIKSENPETYEPGKDLLCGIHTQQGVNYSLLGQSTRKGDVLHLWFYPNGNKRIDEKNRAREIFAIEVIIPKGCFDD